MKTFCFGMMLALYGIFSTVAANAQDQHSSYFEALSDLRAARELLLQHVNNNGMTHNEKEALRQINVIIKEITEAPVTGIVAHDDKEKTQKAQDGNLLAQSMSFLKKAREVMAHEKDGQFADGLRDRSVKNCDEAIKFIHQDQASVLHTTAN